MEELKANRLKKRHFSRLHEKIQNKYNAMKLKLDKSKSVDSLTTLSDDYNFSTSKSNSSLNLNSECVEKIVESEPEYVFVTNKVVEVDYKTVEKKEESTRYSEVFLFETNGGGYKTDICIDKKEDVFLGGSFNTSLESLNEVHDDKSFEEELLATSPSPKMSLGNRIGHRIAAAKERRKREELEKPKKKDLSNDVEKYLLSNTTKYDVSKKKHKIATYIASIALIDGTISSTSEANEEKPRNISCRLRLGSQKRRSKIIKTSQTKVVWQELFQFGVFEDQIDKLEITMWDNSAYVGKTIIDFEEYEKQKTYKLRLNLEEVPVGTSDIFILLTLSGYAPEDSEELDNFETLEKKLDAEEFSAQHTLSNDYTNFKQVGRLSVVVYRAKGLTSNECYCVVEVCNERLQTHTNYTANDPNWMKLFNFSVSDITSVLQITIMDEKKCEEIGKILIPLLKIDNRVKRWYALKDSTLRERARGNDPKVFLEMYLKWDIVKASIRVINPKELIYLQTEAKFERPLFRSNWNRTKVIVQWALEGFRVIKTCFEWESKKLNFIALKLWLIFCWNFKIWMIPLLIIVPFVWSLYGDMCRIAILKKIIYYFEKYKRIQPLLDVELSDDIGEKVKAAVNTLAIENDASEKKKTLRQKITSIQEMVTSVQNTLGKFACLGESVKNLFNFTVPFVSYLAIFILLLISFIMYHVPTKYIFMLWGIHKFTRKWLRPNRIPNNEIMDLLSRIPDDETVIDYEEVPLKEVPKEIEPEYH